MELQASDGAVGPACQKRRRRDRLRRRLWIGLLVAGAGLAAAWGVSLRVRSVLPVLVGTTPVPGQNSAIHFYRYLALTDGAITLSRGNVTTMPSTRGPDPRAVRHLFFAVYEPFRGNRTSVWGRLLGPPNFGQDLTIPLAPVATGCLLAGWCVYRRDRRLRIARMCRSCGYDLRGLTHSSTCPECGRDDEELAGALRLVQQVAPSSR